MGTDARRRIAVSIGSPHNYIPRKSPVIYTHCHLRGGFIVKIKKRILSFALAVMLIVAMAIPASATIIIRDHQWSGFSYSTSDQCLKYSFDCLIESNSAEYTLRTDVEVYTYMPGEPNPYYRTYTGNTGTYLAQNQQSDIYYLIGHIRCLHYVGNTFASVERVERYA